MDRRVPIPALVAGLLVSFAVPALAQEHEGDAEAR